MSIKGKKVALTGKFTTMKRAEAGKKVEALGAVLMSGVSKNVDILIAGEKAGSKLSKAQSLGITIHDEAWLTELLAGAPAEAAPAEAAPAEAAPAADVAGGSLAGKNIVLTGTFTTVKRADAAKKLAALGASIGSSVSKKTDLLVAGEKAGSKLSKAQSLGVAIQDESWLTAILSGEATAVEALDAPSSFEAPKIEGPLADFFPRLEAIVDKLAEDPRVKVGYLREAPISEAALARIESAWKCELAPAIKNFYRQANGFTFYWLATHDPAYQRDWDFKRHSLFGSIEVRRPGFRPTQRPPVPYEVEGFPNGGPHGFVWLLPLDKAMVRKKGFIDFHYGGRPDSEEQQVYGRVWKGEELERSIRMFEYGVGGYYPVGFLTEEGNGDPTVLVGDDHGACWTDGRFVSFETYMENLLATYAGHQARRNLLAGALRREVEQGAREPQVDFESLLPPSDTLVTRDDGATFEIEVIELSELSATEARAQRIADHYQYQLNRIGKALAIKAPSKLEPFDLARQIAEATADMKALDAKTAKAVAGAVFAQSKTKKAVAEKLFCDMEPSTLAKLTVTAVFDHQSFKAADLDRMYGGLTSLLDGHAEVVSLRLISAEGRKERVGSVEAVVAAGHSLEAGQTIASTATPNGYVSYEGSVYRKYE